jgi:hypothetical protein
MLKDSPNINTIVDGIDNEDVGGFVTIEVIRDGKNGPEVIDRRVTHNLVVNAGKRQIWRLAAGNQTNIFDQMRIGTSGAAANSGHTNVLSPVTGTLNTVDSKSLLSATRTMEWVISYPSGGGTKSATGIEEVVLLNQNTSPGGSCMMRAVFTAVNKTTADKLKITYNARIT